MLVDEALKVDEKASTLEDAGNVFLLMSKHAAQYGHKNNEKAMQYFKRSYDKFDSSSKNTLIGLGRCHFNNYYSSNKSVQKCKELKKAIKYYKQVKNKRQVEEIYFAKMYNEMSKFDKSGTYFEDAKKYMKTLSRKATRRRIA